MLIQLKESLQKIQAHRKQLRSKTQLDALFSILDLQTSNEEKCHWFARLLVWLSDDLGSEARARFFWQVLDRQPEWKKKFEILFNEIAKDFDLFTFLSEAGLPEKSGFLSEAFERLHNRILPSRPLHEDPAEFCQVLFPDSDYSDWFLNWNLNPWMNCFDQTAPPELKRQFRQSAKESILLLAIELQAQIVHVSFRRHLRENFSEQEPLLQFVNQISKGFESGNFDPAFALLTHAWTLVDQVHEKVQSRGVSFELVFQIEKLRILIERCELLIRAWKADFRSEAELKALLAHLIQLNHRKRSLHGLVQQGTFLLSRKIVEKNSETGEHYVAKDKKESWSLFKNSCGGGALTALTVYIKLLITSFHLPLFIEGFLASVNYSLSFLVIHLSHFTLATKQPASTATWMASQMKKLNHGTPAEELSPELSRLIRSQFIAVFGNLVMVIPVCMALTLLSVLVFDLPLVNQDKANSTLHSLSFIGGSWPFAAYTGVLLWISSLFAGWADNWFVFYDLKERLRFQPTLQIALGDEKSKTLSEWFERNIAPLAANISLGFLLGLTPVVFSFLGLPIEVRHVTLSAGSLASALPTLGWEVFSHADIYLAIIGILGIGAINIGVSFALAFSVALKAENVSVRSRKKLLRALRKSFFPSKGA